MSQHDLSRLATALEYVDLGAAVYLSGGSDQAARLLAAAAEQLLGDVVRLVDGPFASDDTLVLLERIARGYQSKAAPMPSERRRLEADASAPVREETEAYLRASWFMLEALGLAALAPDSLARAVEKSTVFSSGDDLEPFC